MALSVGFHGGAIGSFSACSRTPGAPRNRFELWGDTGTLRLEPDPAVYTQCAIDGVATGRWSPLVADDGSSIRRIFVERFAGAVLAGRAPDVTAGDGLATQAFVDAAYRSIEEGRAVDVPTSERAPV